MEEEEGEKLRWEEEEKKEKFKWEDEEDHGIKAWEPGLSDVCEGLSSLFPI